MLSKYLLLKTSAVLSFGLLILNFCYRLPKLLKLRIVKAQTQDIRFWRGGNPESASPAAPDSPIMGVVSETAGADPQQAAASSGAPEQSPSATPEERAEGSTGAGARIIPFQTLPASVKARLSDDLFEDPLLTPATMAELRDKMKWSYQFMQVSCTLIEYFSIMFPSTSNTEFELLFQDIANRSFLKSQALQETADNSELLAQKDALVKRCFDEYLDMRNKYNDLVHERTREQYLLRKEIESLKKNKKELQEQNQSKISETTGNQGGKFLFSPVSSCKITQRLNVPYCFQASQLSMKG